MTSPETLLRQLRWRYATKRFDPSRKIPPAEWSALEQVLVLSPSSFGLQPWRFVVIEDPALRQRLRAVSWNQPQVVEASHLVAFAARRGIEPSDVERWAQRLATVRGVSAESIATYRDMMLGWVKRGDIDLDAWCDRQVYLALGTFLTSAAMLGIDACPMEGIEPAGWDEVLGLRGGGYGAVVAAAAGYRAAGVDPIVGFAKARFDAAEVILRR